MIAPKNILADDPHACLMMQFRAGDTDALSQLFEQYHRPLWSFFYKRLADKQQTDDAVQDVFVRIIRYAGHYEPVAKFSTWMFTIATNIARDRLRSHKRTRRVLEDRKNAKESFYESVQEQKMEFLEEVDRLKKRIETLPDRQQLAFQLYYVEEKPYCEIADELKATPMAVKGLLARGRRTLRSQIAN